MALLAAACLTVAAGATQAAPAANDRNNACGSLVNHYGPYDYRTDQHKLGIVERFHFTPEIESLIRGKTGDDVESDLDYTLRAFPNHARALVTLDRLGRRTRSPQPGKLPLPIACYYERALRFRQDDVVVRMLYASFLDHRKQRQEAIAHLDYVAQIAGDNALTHHNAGLLYFDMGQMDKALAQAQKALALGSLRTDLRDKLKARGLWREAPPPTATRPAPSASR